VSDLVERLREAERARVAAIDAAHAQYREAVLAELDGGASLRDVGAVLGVTRQRVHQLVGRRGPSEMERIIARLTVLDARWAKLVDAFAAREKPVPETVKFLTAKKNARRGIRARRGLPPERTVLAEVRDYAESLLLHNLAQHRGERVVDLVVAEIDESAALRERLAALSDAGAPELAD
jgi:hypothetical protein